MRGGGGLHCPVNQSTLYGAVRLRNAVKLSRNYGGVQSTRIDVSSIPAGSFYVTVKGSAEQPVTLKMIKQ